MLSYFWFYNGSEHFCFFVFFKLPVFYESKQHKPLSGRVSYKSWCKHLLTVFISVSLSFFFFKSNVYCWWWMYLFPVPPSPLPRINAQCVRLRWRQDRFFFLFFVLFLFFSDLKLRIKKTQTYPLTMICEVVFFCGKPDIFSNSIKGLWHLVSVTPDSL